MNLFKLEPINLKKSGDHTEKWVHLRMKQHSCMVPVARKARRSQTVDSRATAESLAPNPVPPSEVS
jgi:hypothetical protein